MSYLFQASDGIVEVTACADTTPGNSNCCEYTHPIRVKNCGHFMVYDLLPTIGCSIAYCAGKIPFKTKRQKETFNP